MFKMSANALFMAMLTSPKDPAKTLRRMNEAGVAFQLINASAEEVPLADASLDAVVSQYGIEYSDMDRSLPEAATTPRARSSAESLAIRVLAPRTL